MFTECIPSYVFEALKDPKWKATMMEEINALDKSQTWHIVNFPEGKLTVECNCKI